MKKLFILIIALIIAFSSLTVFADNKISLYINGTYIDCDVPPTIVNSRTLCPTRAIFTAFGAEVSWNDAKKQVTMKKDDINIVLTVGSNIALVNSQKVTLDCAPIIISDRCMVPIRFISEALGCEVNWVDAERSVQIIYNQFKISDIKLKESSKTHSVVDISYSGTKEPKTFVLSYSNCIVMDFNETNLAFKDAKISIDNDIIKELRYAQHPDYARVVIECKDEYKYTSTLENGIYSITVGDKSDDSENNTTTTQKPTTSTPVTDEDMQIPAKEFMATRDENNLLVVLDAGHGGKDPGTVYTNDEGEIELKEKDVNLTITNKVYSILKQRGINVERTRSKDEFLELSKITDIANSYDADLFVSIHNNAMENNPDVSGMMVLYNGDALAGSYGIDSKTVATNIDKKIASYVDIKDRGIVSRPGLWVLRKTAMPAVLVECAFISNEGDRKLLTDDKVLDAFALGIADGIEKSLETMKKNIVKAKEELKETEKTES